MDRLRALTYGTVLLIGVGWVLHVGKAIFVPAVLAAVIVYVIVGLAQALGRLPGLGAALPSRLRYLLSFALIGLMDATHRLSLEQIDERYPALVPTLVGHPGVGFVLAVSDREGAVVLGPRGRRLPLCPRGNPRHGRGPRPPLRGRVQ